MVYDQAKTQLRPLRIEEDSLVRTLLEHVEDGEHLL